MLIIGGTHIAASRIGHKRRLTAQGAGENRYKQFSRLVYDIEWMGQSNASQSGQQFTLTCYACKAEGPPSREMALWYVTYDSLASLFKAQPFDARMFTLE